MDEPYQPTPEEIAEAAAEIRKDWDEKETKKREARKSAPWEVPVVKSPGFDEEPKE